MPAARFPIHPAWWPALVALSPLVAPLMAVQHRRFVRDRARAEELNRERLLRARPLELPELDFLELTVLVEWKTQPGFLAAAGVSYLLRTDRGAVLFDVGFGADTPALVHNARRLGFTLDGVDAVAISHLHVDHMGGMRAARRRVVTLPPELAPSRPKPCYVPDRAEAAGLAAEVVLGPRLLAAGIGSTGPLARGLFFLGLTEEQALIANVRGKGLVVVTGCGHQTVGGLLPLVRRLSDRPLYALCGGLHFPLTDGRGNLAGIRLQMLLGTGKPPWRLLGDADLTDAIRTIDEAAPAKVLVSGHDTCDHALARLRGELHADTGVLEAGATHRL